MLLSYKELRAYLKTEGFLAPPEPLVDQDDHPFWVAVLACCQALFASGKLTFDPYGVSGVAGRARRALAVAQAYLAELGLYDGRLDGLEGPATQGALDRYQTFRKDGGEVYIERAMDDDVPAPAGGASASVLAQLRSLRKPWPNYRNASMAAFYGPPGTGIVKVTLPFPHRLAWDLGTTVSSTWIHGKCAESWLAIKEAQLGHYGRDGIREHRIDHFGGVFNKRKVRGGAIWSTHAYGAAEDLDPAHNQFRWRADQASLDAAIYDPLWAFYEAAGWRSMGRDVGYDYMHVQAATFS